MTSGARSIEAPRWASLSYGGWWLGLPLWAWLGVFVLYPLVSVLLGILFLREKLRPAQWLPVGIAAAGVVFLTVSYGGLPWVSLVLAVSFGLYGLIKKTAPLGSLQGLTIETAMLILPATGFLLYSEANGTGDFGHMGLTISLLLAFTGVVTAIPLLLFAAGTPKVPLSTVGLLQYISPTLQFITGVFIFRETSTQEHLIGFAILLAFADTTGAKRWKLDRITLKSAIVIGLSQCLALIPGVSRSGITITAALLLGYNRETSARFSFLLSLPIVFGAAILKVGHLLKTGIPAGETTPLLIGVASSAIFGYLSVMFLLKLVQRYSLYPFVWYRLLAGAGFLVYFLGIR